jgi:hypothetical protein
VIEMRIAPRARERKTSDRGSGSLLGCRIGRLWLCFRWCFGKMAGINQVCMSLDLRHFVIVVTIFGKNDLKSQIVWAARRAGRFQMFRLDKKV